MMGSNRRDWLTVNCMELGLVYVRGLLQSGAWRLVWGQVPYAPEYAACRM